MNVWLVAASGPEAQRHLQDTIERPIALDLVCRTLGSEEWAQVERMLANRQELYAWGATGGPQNTRKWSEMKPGDLCLFYAQRKFRYAATVLLKLENEQLARSLWGTNTAGETWRYIYFLDTPHAIDIPLETFNKEHGYNPNFVVQGFMKVNPEAVQAVEDRYGSYRAFLGINESNPSRGRADLRADLRAVCDAFADALKGSNLDFGARHLDIVRSFVASLATKRFVILSGLSGSGKTQIALRFGEWIGGTDYSMKVPVRPDWTGSEALFGYEDALLEPARDGRRSWHVPRPLEFMLRAAADPERPYLLVLDEMNLAHVERYFADMLSGMESDYPCLPNLQREGQFWRLPPFEPRWIAVPRNLFVVGTVNVDETTYMFSPKVLDRANTLEFRVSAQDLRHDARHPRPCRPGESRLVSAFLEVATDPDWHLRHPAPELNAFADHLRRVHTILAPAGFEFGHRVYSEAIRFACILYACGEEDSKKALDLQIMQKILPRLHGSRRRLESTLVTLAQFCFDPDAFQRGATPQQSVDPETQDPSEAKLGISFARIQRMLRILRANQFVSFAE